MLVFYNLELRWYRDNTVHLLANRLSTSLRMAQADVGRALDQGRKGDYAATSEWLSAVEVELQGASVAESGYNLALDSRFAREAGHATGLGMTISTYGSEAKSERLDLARNGWTPAIEAHLTDMAYDLNLIANLLTEELLGRANYGDIRSGADAVKGQLKTQGVHASVAAPEPKPDTNPAEPVSTPEPKLLATGIIVSVRP